MYHSVHESSSKLPIGSRASEFRIQSTQLIPIGAPEDKKSDENGKEGPQKNSFLYRTQQGTLFASIIAQVAGLVLSVYAYVQGGDETNPKPDILMTILLMEIIVQAIELGWYGFAVWKLDANTPNGVKVWYRYFDWLISTPLMLFTLCLFIFYQGCNSITLENVMDNQDKRTGIIVAVASNIAMLVAGFIHEYLVKDDPSSDAAYAWLIVGFYPFVMSFLPITLFAYDTRDFYAYLATFVTFSVWALYGAVSLYWYGPENRAAKNAVYNILDVVAKNISAIVISIVAIDYAQVSIAGNSTQCS